MAVKSIEQLKQLFKAGDTPNQQAFWDWLESFRHSLIKITAADLDNQLYAVIAGLPDSQAYNQMLSAIDAKVSAEDVAAALAAATGVSVAPLYRGGLPAEYLPAEVTQKYISLPPGKLRGSCRQVLFYKRYL